MVTLAREEKLLIWAKGIEEQGFGIIPNVLAQQDVEDLLEELSLANLPRSRAGVRHAMRLAKSQSHAPRRVLHIEYAASACIADGLELTIA